MVALLTDIPTYDEPTPPALRLLPPGPVHSRRPDPLRRASRPGPETFRRRRMAAIGLLVLGACLVVIAVQAALGRAGGGPLTTTGAAGGLRPAAAVSWVVRPGDTLWSIATAIAPGHDARPIVDRLAAEVGSGPLYPGEVVPIPAGLG